MEGRNLAKRDQRPRGRTREDDEPNEVPLSTLFARMRSATPEVAEAAWGEVYRRYHERVWARVFYVIRTIPWLREPREVASDVTTQVFIGLPTAVQRYRDMGRAEQWLLRIALRTALRHREKLTGRWSEGRRESGADSPAPRGRSYFDLDAAIDHISYLMSEVEMDERLELRRRLDEWRADPSRARWLELVELFLEGYSHDEIAERLGISPRTSRTWLWKIRKELARPRHAGEDDEVRGRAADREPDVVPIRPGAGAHLEPDVLERFADGLLDAQADAAAAAHVTSCAICDEQVTALRRGLAVLALGSRPPGDLADRVRTARAAGLRTLLQPEVADAWAAGSAEAVGRDADADDDPKSER